MLPSSFSDSLFAPKTGGVEGRFYLFLLSKGFHAVGKVEFVLIGSHDVALCVAYVKIGNIMIPVAGVGEIALFYPVAHGIIAEFEAGVGKPKNVM